MSLTTLLIIIAIVSAVLTGVVAWLKNRDIHWLTTYLQSYTGTLFLVSGWVKAMDPLGTAFKMEQYFAEFESTFDGTAFDFLAPLFPWLSNLSVGFSVFMIIFEIVLGLMLLIGHRRKLASWLFLLLVIFFTALTGFTFLTGYVPSGENFFAFSKWGPYDAVNMRVTDCGCFGDFIKLEPRISFLKDVFLLIPAIYFVFRHKTMHTLFTANWRNGILGAATAGLFLYCLSNFMWDLPHTDFRPFKEGVNIAKQKAIEEEAAGNVQVIAFKLENTGTGEVIQLDSETYLKNYSSYPKETWKVIEQIKSEPEIKPTKISDFVILDSNGDQVTDELLSIESPALMIVCYKLYGEGIEESVTVYDTTYATIDTVLVDEEGNVIGDTTLVTDEIAEITERTETAMAYSFDAEFVERFTEYFNPLTEQARKAGMEVFGVIGGASGEKIRAFANAAGISYPLYEADDILLKTIIRSNPGLVLLQEGEIKGKWHYRKLPELEELQARTGK